MEPQLWFCAYLALAVPAVAGLILLAIAGGGPGRLPPKPPLDWLLIVAEYEAACAAPSPAKTEGKK